MMENQEQWRELDPVKISITGLNMFIKKHGLKPEIYKDATLNKRLEYFKPLSKDVSIPEKDRKDMTNILETLGKIADCELCHKEIIWDKQAEALYTINPIAARHLDCHRRAEGK